MPKTTIIIKTWSCVDCGYKQDFEPTEEKMKEIFNDDKRFLVSDVADYECPNCALSGIRGKQLSLETDTSRKIRINVMGKEELEDYVFYDGRAVPSLNADHHDEEEKQRSASLGKPHNPKPRRKLSKAEKEQIEAKIDDDIRKAKALEDLG